MAELRLGIAGLGSAGMRRLAAARVHPRVRVVAVADPVVRPPGVPHVPDVAALLDHGLDALCVCLPTDGAARWTVAALERGLHVLCEKPPARSVAELRPVLGARGARVLRYGFNHRLHDGPQFASRHLPSIGAVRSVQGVYARPALAPEGGWRADPLRAGGGVLLDQGIHLVDLARWLLGPLSLVAATVSHAPDMPGLEDHVDLALRTSAGAPVSLRSSAREPHRFALTLRGERGAIALRGLHTSSRAYIPETASARDANGHVTASISSASDPSWDRELAGFVAHVLDGVDDGHGAPDDALALLALIDEIRATAPERASA